MSVHHTRLKLLLPTSSAPTKAIDLSFLPARLQTAARAWPSLVTTSPETGTLSLYIDSRILWAASVLCAALLLILVYRLSRGAWGLLLRVLRRGHVDRDSKIPSGSTWSVEKRPFTHAAVDSPWSTVPEKAGAIVVDIPSDAPSSLDSSEASSEDSDGIFDAHYRSRSYYLPRANADAALPMRPAGGRSSSFSQVPSARETAARRRRRSLFGVPRLAVRKRRSADGALEGYEEV